MVVTLANGSAESPIDGQNGLPRSLRSSGWWQRNKNDDEVAAATMAEGSFRLTMARAIRRHLEKIEVVGTRLAAARGTWRVAQDDRRRTEVVAHRRSMSKKKGWQQRLGSMTGRSKEWWGSEEE